MCLSLQQTDWYVVGSVVWSHYFQRRPDALYSLQSCSFHVTRAEATEWRSINLLFCFHVWCDSTRVCALSGIWKALLRNDLNFLPSSSFPGFSRFTFETCTLDFALLAADVKTFHQQLGLFHMSFNVGFNCSTTLQLLWWLSTLKRVNYKWLPGVHD